MLISSQIEVFVSMVAVMKCVCVVVLVRESVAVVGMLLCVGECVSEVLIKKRAGWLQLLIFEADF